MTKDKWLLSSHPESSKVHNPETLFSDPLAVLTKKKNICFSLVFKLSSEDQKKMASYGLSYTGAGGLFAENCKQQVDEKSATEQRICS